jgi:soluble cytochrome b562
MTRITERARIERAVDARTDNLQVIIDTAQREAVKRELARVRRIGIKLKRNSIPAVHQIPSMNPVEAYEHGIDDLLSALRGKGTR